MSNNWGVKLEAVEPDEECICEWEETVPTAFRLAIIDPECPYHGEYAHTTSEDADE